jgi:small subunit ribosomal protein S3
MGQKVNPTIYRLKNKDINLYSTWIKNSNQFSQGIIKDYNLRKKIIKEFPFFGNTLDIYVFRNSSYISKNALINIKIVAIYPKEKEIRYFIKKNTGTLNTDTLKESYIVYIKNKIKNFIDSQFVENKNIFCYSFVFYKSIYENPRLICNYIANLIQKRVPYKRILKEVIQNSINSSIKGLKIMLSGRLNGAEIAKTEFKLVGTMPLQSIDKNIKMCKIPVKTVYGIIGIKVWVYFE